MSHPSRDRSITILEGDGLAVIREEQTSPPHTAHPSRTNSSGQLKKEEDRPRVCGDVTYTPKEVEDMLMKREEELRAEFDNDLKTQIRMMTDRFDLILQNEQVRTCFMLREAHRERKEKVQALQTQLECKNMTGLMYVLCSERRKCKMEKLKIIEEYTKYIHTLQDILTEGQLLILHLSRGYKTAARVDHEWREKMKSIIKEFQEYVYHFAGGTPESNQYVFDVPALLKTEASILDDLDEDPCTCPHDMAVVDEEEEYREKTWWEMLDSAESRPFVMYGDMEEFKPPKRREVVAAARTALAKTAPPKWKEYVFDDMFLKSDCPHAEVIKDEYPHHLPIDKWNCHQFQSPDSDSIGREQSGSRRTTVNSIDMRAMGSILKIIASSTNSHSVPPLKTNLLGARDSMEIASTTKLREKKNGCRNGASKNVSICIARPKAIVQNNNDDDSNISNDGSCEKEERRRISMAKSSPVKYDSQELEVPSRDSSRHVNLPRKERHEKDGGRPRRTTEAEIDEDLANPLGSVHQDSIHVIGSHKPDPDHKINYEKICPMDQCQRMQVDSFVRSLPAYMRASPFTLFEQSYADYETCSPEQLEIIKQRIETKRKSHIQEEDLPESECEFERAVDGVAVQTSDYLIDDLPACTCRDPHPSIASSNTRVFRVEDLLPMKEALDEITKECFHNQRIQFNRFRVVGQEDTRQNDSAKQDKDEFKKKRVEEIKNILRQHPSMLDLFQPNPRC